jgi:BTB/POZ domain
MFVRSLANGGKSFVNSPIVTIYVGIDRKVYMFHKDLLVSKCPYLRACLAGGFRDSKSNEIFLSEYLPEAFNCLVKWLYTGAVSSVERISDARTVFHSYVRGDAFLVTELKNDLMDGMHQLYTRQFMDVQPLNLLAKNEVFNVQLRDFVLEQFAYDLLDDDDYSKDMTTKIDAFLASGSSAAVGAFCALRKLGAYGHDDPSKRKGCRYHDHPKRSQLANLQRARTRNNLRVAGEQHRRGTWFDYRQPIPSELHGLLQVGMPGIRHLKQVSDGIWKTRTPSNC